MQLAVVKNTTKGVDDGEAEGAVAACVVVELELRLEDIAAEIVLTLILVGSETEGDDSC